MPRVARLALTALLLAAPALAADLGGKWEFTWFTEGGVRESVMVFKQTGDTLVATINEVELNGKVDGDAFTLSGDYYSPEAGYAGSMAIEGTIDGDQMKGEGKWDMHPMAFRAKRAAQE